MNLKDKMKMAMAVGAATVAAWSGAAPQMNAQSEQDPKEPESLHQNVFADFAVKKDAKTEALKFSLLGVSIDTEAFNKAKETNGVLKNVDLIVTAKELGLRIKNEDGTAYQIYALRNQVMGLNQVKDKDGAVKKAEKLDVALTVCEKNGNVRVFEKKDAEPAAKALLSVANAMDDAGLIDLNQTLAKASGRSVWTVRMAPSSLIRSEFADKLAQKADAFQQQLEEKGVVSVKQMALNMDYIRRNSGRSD